MKPSSDTMRSRALRVSSAALVAILFVLAISSTAYCEEYVIDRFSPDSAIGVSTGWQRINFPSIPKRTTYSVERAGDNWFMKAVSVNSASAVYKAVDIDLKEFPILMWRWKILGTIDGGDARRKDGDDYAARVYIMFAFDSERSSLGERLRNKASMSLYGRATPSVALNYIWANRLDKGSAVANPFSEKTIMVAVESGPRGSGRWHEESRDVYEDFKNFFGYEPPRAVGVAVMTDSDNTGTSATAYYDDIVFKSERVPHE